MKIEFVFDIVYPMSYVAFQKLKKNWNEQTSSHIELLPIQAVPEIPEQGLNVLEYLTEKYGSTAAQRKLEMTKFAAYSEDIEVNIEHMKRMPNSRLAHQAILALENTLDKFALTQALFHAIFAHGKDISDAEVLKISLKELDWMAIMFSVRYNIKKLPIISVRSQNTCRV